MFGRRKCDRIANIVLTISYALLILCDATDGRALSRLNREIIDSQTNDGAQTNSRDNSSGTIGDSVEQRKHENNVKERIGVGSASSELMLPEEIPEISQAETNSQLPLKERKSTTSSTTASVTTLSQPFVTATEKRGKILVDPKIDVSETTQSIVGVDASWSDLKAVGEVNHNNVTFSRTTESEEAVKNNSVNSVTETAQTIRGDDAQLPKLKIPLDSNSSHVDDSVHQDISLTPSQTTHATTTAKTTTTPLSSSSLSTSSSSSTTSTSQATASTSTMPETLLTTTPSMQFELHLLDDSTTKRSDETNSANKISSSSTKTIQSTTPADTTHFTEILTTPIAEQTADTGRETTKSSEETTEMAADTTDFETSTMTPIMSTIESEQMKNASTSTEKIVGDVEIADGTRLHEMVNKTEKMRENSIDAQTTEREHNEIETTSEVEATTSSKKLIPIVSTTHSVISHQPTIKTTPASTTIATTVSTASPVPRTSPILTTSSSTVSPSSTTTTTTTTSTPSTTIPVETSTMSSTTSSSSQSPSVETTRPKDPPRRLPEEETTTENAVPEETETSYPTRVPIVSNPSQGEDVRKGGTDINAMVAIIISIISVITLILLVGFLLIMRKRQKQLTYGQRCRPVGLDDYSLDNISIYNSVRRKNAMRASKRAYGNAAFDDPSLKNNPLSIGQLATFVTKRTAINEEFREVPLVTARIEEVPAGCEDKNRYANVVPLPESRVHLNRIDDDETTEYINANYVKGPKDTTHYYIACQAPLENTILDFWRMIWEQNSRVIIMATDLTENGIEKCAEYLPPSFVIDNHVTFGDFNITLKNREVRDKYAVSTVHVKNGVTKSWREITHLWYQWPESGVPTDEASIIAMLLEARSYLKMAMPEQSVADECDDGDLADMKIVNGNSEKTKSLQRVQGPLTVHCSPGTGRTGTIIACDIALRTLEQPTRSVDVPLIVYAVRRGRASAVQTREQYEFIYKVAHVYATKLMGPVNDN